MYMQALRQGHIKRMISPRCNQSFDRHAANYFKLSPFTPDQPRPCTAPQRMFRYLLGICLIVVARSLSVWPPLYDCPQKCPFYIELPFEVPCHNVQVRYCGRSCQEADWETHQHFCLSLEAQETHQAFQVHLAFRPACLPFRHFFTRHL